MFQLATLKLKLELVTVFVLYIQFTTFTTTLVTYCLFLVCMSYWVNKRNFTSTNSVDPIIPYSSPSQLHNTRVRPGRQSTLWNKMNKHIVSNASLIE